MWRLLLMLHGPPSFRGRHRIPPTGWGAFASAGACVPARRSAVCTALNPAARRCGVRRRSSIGPERGGQRSTAEPDNEHVYLGPSEDAMLASQAEQLCPGRCQPVPERRTVSKAHPEVDQVSRLLSGYFSAQTGPGPDLFPSPSPHGILPRTCSAPACVGRGCLLGGSGG